MNTLVEHQDTIRQSLASWERKPLLRSVYDGFYQRTLKLIRPDLDGLVVEIGSGMGNLKQYLPQAVCTDLFPNRWLDLVCDGYELPFTSGSVSHLLLFDVFHHLSAPRAFLREAARVMQPEGRLILFEPYISLASSLFYGLFHREPIAWRQDISLDDKPPAERAYYAAQGNATRLFFRQASPACLEGWTPFHREAFSAFNYLLSGGYSKPACYPARTLAPLRRLDDYLTRWPRLFGARCLVGLTPAAA